MDERLDYLGYTLWQGIGFAEPLKKLVLNNESTKLLLNKFIVTGATVAFRKETKKYVLPIPAEWIHDAWIAYITAYFFEISIIDESLIFYRQHSKQQIGVRNKNKVTQINNVILFTLAFQRIKMFQYDLKNVEISKPLENMLKHFKFRVNMPKEKYKRLIPIFYELISLRYHKYGSGFLSAAKDIIR